MSYNLTKGNQKSGDITFEDDSDTKLDFEADSIALVVGGVNALVATDDLAGHFTGSAGDILKLENSTAYGVTYGQLVKTSLTITGSSPIDTTLDLPAASVIDAVVLKVTTAGAVNSGSDYNITNVSLTAGSSTNSLASSSLSGMSLIGSSYVSSGTMYYINNTDHNYPAGAHGMLNVGSTSDIKVDYSSSDVRNNAVVDVIVFYKKFDMS